jgi:hypothetical protein
MMHVRRAVACCGALAVSLCAWSGTATGADPASKAVAVHAVDWLATEQQVDGGFESAGAPGFETRDATLAIAENAQTGPTWSVAEALAAVQSLEAGGSGPTPLAFLESDTNVANSAGGAAKTIVLTALPLGVDPTHFGSLGNLVTTAGADCSTVPNEFLNNNLYVLLADKLLCGSIPPAALATVRAAQQANGGWNFTGDPTGTDIDNDTTALAVEVLVASGADASDPAVHGALVFFAQNLQANGAWQFFGSDDPNSTAMALIGITAAGFDPAVPCWRDTVTPASTGTPYPSPDAWLRSQQQPNGQIASPNDAGFPSTFATSQAVEGLLRAWLPILRASAHACPPPSTPTPTPASPAVRIQPNFPG